MDYDWASSGVSGDVAQVQCVVLYTATDEEFEPEGIVSLPVQFRERAHVGNNSRSDDVCVH